MPNPRSTRSLPCRLCSAVTTAEAIRPIVPEPPGRDVLKEIKSFLAKRSRPQGATVAAILTLSVDRGAVSTPDVSPGFLKENIGVGGREAQVRAIPLC